MLFPYRKRIDFDFNMVTSRIEEIVVEIDPHSYQRLETEILQMIDPLDLPVKDEVHRIMS